jgi:hypothetical protein
MGPMVYLIFQMFHLTTLSISRLYNVEPMFMKYPHDVYGYNFSLLFSVVAKTH